MSSIRKSLSEDTVFRLSVLLGMIGLLTIYGSSMYINIEPVDISDIEKSWSGKSLMVQGEIAEVRTSSGHLFFNLKQGKDSIKVVKFDSQSSYSNGDRVNVTGHVEIYKGELEIVAKEIES